MEEIEDGKPDYNILQKCSELGLDWKETEEETSELLMNELQNTKTTMVDAIILEAEKRKLVHVNAAMEANRLRKEKLESEVMSCLKQFEELTEKWSKAKEKEIPEELRDIMVEQQQLCSQIIEDKNKLIAELQQELKEVDKRYVKEMEKMEKDVDLFISCMKTDIASLKQAYKENLDQTEKSFTDERSVLLSKNKTKWEHQREDLRNREMELLQQRIKLLDEHNTALQTQRIRETEEVNHKKVQLESEIESYEQRLQIVKASNLMSELILDEDIKELKKRIEENAIIKAEQKRKITKLHGVLHKLKTKCANQEKQSQEETQLLLDGLKRSMQKYNGMQEKLRQIKVIDAKRFEDMWVMKEEEAKDLVKRVLETDRLIHEQVLGVSWNPPPLPFREHSGPFDAQREAQRAAACGMSGRNQESEGEGSASGDSAALKRDTFKMDPKTFNLFKQLCDKEEFDFLIDNEVLMLLPLLEEDEHYFVKVYSIFKALGIKKDRDIYKMAEFFAQFTQQLKEREEEEISIEELVSELDLSRINQNDVLKALRAFTEQYLKPRDPQQLLEDRDFSGDAAYWHSIGNVLPESRLKVWTALEKALDKYHLVLKKRAQLVEEGHTLKQQNTELKKLLQQFQGQCGPESPIKAIVGVKSATNPPAPKQKKVKSKS